MEKKMEKEIVEEIMRECGISDRIITKTLISICKYYKVDNAKKITKYIKNNIKI